MNPSGFKLYARPSFWEGLVRLIDAAGTLNYYNYSNSPEQADIRALLSDWEAVGMDICTAIRQFDTEKYGRIYLQPSE